jgi:hydrogenase/urease accessory protein HupE
MRTKLIATLVALTFAGSAGAALAHGKTACEERGVNSGPLTHPVHHLHEELPAGGGLVHQYVEPLTCDPPQVP